MTDIQKIAAILASKLPDALKLELVGLITKGDATQPVIVPYPIYPNPYPTWQPWPSWTICSGTGSITAAATANSSISSVTRFNPDDNITYTSGVMD